MKKPINITTPLTAEVVEKLKAWDIVYISGRIFTARDMAHKLLYDYLKKGKTLPFDLKGQLIYYTGPTAAPKGKVIGSCGPTTSSRMDKFSPALLKAGLAGMIGKGRRGEEVIEAIKKFKAVYFAAPSGCGAYLSKRVKKAEVFKFKELGPEAIFSLEVECFPCVVAVDSKGENIYK
ncbi:MAG: FumA C-terminus/TtdB family hydratase beta subunit [Candidatus Omnitrophota bacterium]